MQERRFWGILKQAAEWGEEGSSEIPDGGWGSGLRSPNTITRISVPDMTGDLGRHRLPRLGTFFSQAI